MNEQFPITLILPFNFADAEGRMFQVGRDHERTLMLCRIVNDRAMVVRECTLVEAREWFAASRKGGSK